MAEAAALRQAQVERTSGGGRGGRRVVAWLGAAVLVSLVAACPASARPREAADGYVFGDAEFVRTEFKVTIVEYDDAAAVTEAAIEAGALVAPTVSGSYGRVVRTRVFAWSRLRDGTCEIHILKPAVRYQPELLGHELAHCIYGRWHS